MPCCENKNKPWIIILALILLYVLYCDFDLCNIFGGSPYNNNCNCGRNVPPYCCDWFLSETKKPAKPRAFFYLKKTGLLWSSFRKGAGTHDTNNLPNGISVRFLLLRIKAQTLFRYFQTFLYRFCCKEDNRTRFSGHWSSHKEAAQIVVPVQKTPAMQSLPKQMAILRLKPHLLQKQTKFFVEGK